MKISKYTIKAYKSNKDYQNVVWNLFNLVRIFGYLII